MSQKSGYPLVYPSRLHGNNKISKLLCISYLFPVLALVDPLVADLDARLEQAL